MFSAYRPGAPGTGVGTGDEHGAQHLVEVGGRVGADQQHPPPGLGQRQGHRRGQRGLAHAALAGEEQEAWSGPDQPLERADHLSHNIPTSLLVRR